MDRKIRLFRDRISREADNVDRFIPVRHNTLYKTVVMFTFDREEKGMDNCSACVNYVYDEECECYCCMVNLDEDEMYRFLTGSHKACPYFKLDDEYGVVRHQN